jgi:hypothetical protein
LGSSSATAPVPMPIASHKRTRRGIGCQPLAPATQRRRGTARSGGPPLRRDSSGRMRPSPVRSPRCPSPRQCRPCARSGVRSKPPRFRYEGTARLQRLGLPERAVGANALTMSRWLKAGGSPTHNKPKQPLTSRCTRPFSQVARQIAAAMALGSGASCAACLAPYGVVFTT